MMAQNIAEATLDWNVAACSKGARECGFYSLENLALCGDAGEPNISIIPQLESNALIKKRFRHRQSGIILISETY